MAMEDLAFIKGFCRLCDDGFKQGWHERNGGNLTYRMTDDEVAEAKPFFEEPREWVKMGVRGENLAGQYFVSTGSGKYMRNVLEDPYANIGMSFVVPLEDRVFTRILWQMMTECVVVFPTGVGVVPWMVPGGPAIAEASSELMQTYDAIVWAHHGLFAAGPDFDTTFGLAHTVEKAAEIYLAARAANGGSDDFLNKISDKGLRDTCRDFGIKINEAFVD